MQKVTFTSRLGFYDEVKKQVYEYFEANKLSPHANWRMYLKTAIILLWLATAYVLLVFATSSLIMAIISAVAVAQGFALVGFNIMHDGNHGGYSRSRKVNSIMGFTLNLIGGSSWFWKHKHNILHHTYTNINELDEDIHVDGIMRMSPVQPRRPWHRFQHLYAFPAYSLMSLLWVTIGDFRKFFSGRIGDYKLPKISAGETTLFFLTKVFYFGYMLVLPMFFHPVLQVLAFFVLVHVVLGFSLALTFQLAHVVEGNTFPEPDPASATIENEWAIHEVETTADFAPKSRLAHWYFGGLNFQIEHHLFPRICHIHYPAISKVVKKVCEEFGINYVSYPTVRAAVGAHFRFLRTLGREDEIPEAELALG
jgi:linoleoyl-CoA desaturase